MARTPAGSAMALRGLSIVCFVLYGLSHLGAAIAGWFEYASEQQAHGSVVELFGPDGYAWMFMEQTFQNWQSEFLALGTMVVLTALLIHVGSKHSRDGNDEVQRRVEAIQRRVTALGAGEG